METTKIIYDSESMLANLDRVMRQLRRRPRKTNHAARGTYRLLRTISASSGISTRELAELMGIRRASLNEKLMQLENDGMIRRERDSKDQRVHVVHMEAAGVDYLSNSQEARLKMQDAIKSILTLEETQELAILAGKLAAGLEQINKVYEGEAERDSEESGEANGR